jgi:hypothetical protein
MQAQSGIEEIDQHVQPLQQAHVWALAQALVGTLQRVFTRRRTQEEVRAEVMVERTEAEVEVRAEVMVERTEVEVEAEARAHAQVWALAQALAGALRRVLARQRTQEERAEALALAWTMKEARKLLPAETMVDPVEVVAKVPVVAQMQAQAGTMTYGEVLADPKLKSIIDSIEPIHRHPLAHHLWRRDRSWYWRLIQFIAPITRLPPELLQHIFLIIIDEVSDSPLMLMRVCKHWYTITTGIWASLKLGTRTPKAVVTSKLERNQWLLDVLVDTGIDRGDFSPSEHAYEAIFAAIEAASRWRSFVVETFPAHADSPEDPVNRGFQRSSDGVMSRLRTFRIKSACETSPLLDHLLRILGTTASGELTTVEINSAIVISFLVPTYSSIFHSVTALSLDTLGLRDPVDLLPHLHQLESLTASHLPLPIYHDDVDLPFVYTLRHLNLRAVSIQWMDGRTFHVLESCTLIFPHHRHVLHTFRTTLPKCKDLSFQGHPLDILGGISAYKLAHLSVMCSCCDKLRGNRQLAWFSSQALRENQLAPQILHIGIEAVNKAWITALSFMSNLEELVIHNAQPSSLGAKVLQSLVIQPVHTSNQSPPSTSGEWNTPLPSSPKRFEPQYRRWLRSSKHFDLIQVFTSVIQSMFSLQSPSTVRSPVDRPVHANNLDTTATPGECNTPLCPSLKRFGLRYRRWLRPSEHFDLIPAFKSIIQSREQSKFPLQSFLMWPRGDQMDPLELVKESGISLEGFERLAKAGAINGEDLL